MDTSSPVRGRAARRERVFTSAIALFLERGFEETAMEDIAERAGVSRKTVFNHFPRKALFLEEWSARRRVTAAASVTGPPEPDATARDVVGRYLERLARLNEEHRAETRAVMPYAARLTNALLDHPLGHELAAILHRFPAPRPGTDPELTGRLLALGYFSAVIRWIDTDPAPFDLADELRLLRDTVLGPAPTTEPHASPGPVTAAPTPTTALPGDPTAVRPAGPARAATAPERVADLLREEILDGAHPGGTRLREEALAERFDVGRHTVRAALRLLVERGLVVHERHRGAVVPPLTRVRIDELCDFRITLEVGALRIALATQADLTPVRRAVEKLEGLGDAPWNQITEAHAAVHEAIVSAAGNPHLLDSYARCQDELRVLFTAVRPDFDTARLAALHRDLLRHLEAGGEGAVQALVEDLERTGRTALLSALERTGTG